jgi:hypothetical protein
VLKRIHEALDAVLNDAGLDARTCFVRATPLPPDGSLIDVETSDRAVGQALRRRLALVGEEADRLRIVELPAAGMPARLTVVSSVADVRRTPSHAAELLTQAIYGDALEPLRAEGDWYLIRMDDGYIGWIRSWHVDDVSAARLEAFDGRAGHRVAVPRAELLDAPVRGATPVTDLVIGTRIALTKSEKRGWMIGHLPDGRRGFIRSASVERIPAHRGLSRERLAATGLRFLGIPYLWGGSTPNGFDCSGLVQRIFRLHGVLLPRDSDQQARFGREKAASGPDDLAVGDLLFFGPSPYRITHVAMVVPGGLFLHAYGQVRVNSLDPDHPLFAAPLASIWRSSRDPLDPIAQPPGTGHDAGL